MILLDIQVKIDYHREYCIESTACTGRGMVYGKMGFAG